MTMMTIGNRASKYFLLYDHRAQEETEFRDQHSILMHYYRKVYLEDRVNTYDILCVAYNDQITRVSDELLDAWVKKQFWLEVRVRMLGSDIIDLDKFIDAQGYEIQVDRNPRMQYTEGIDWGYYLTTLRPYERGSHKFGYGATRNEALAHAFMR